MKPRIIKSGETWLVYLPMGYANMTLGGYHTWAEAWARVERFWVDVA